MTHKIFSFFSGAGFLDLGFETTGFEVAFVNEYHAPFLYAYQYSRQQLGFTPPEYGYHFGSITDLLDPSQNRKLSEYVSDSRKSGATVGFIGGPPCPDFSVAGKNRGQEGTNGKLSRVYVDLIVRQKPDYFLFENVKGLWKTKKHREFYEGLKELLVSAGYTLTERLINAIEYGAPQDRERVILLGFRDQDKKLNDNGLGFQWLRDIPYPDRTAFSFDWTETTPYIENSVLPQPSTVPEELTVEYWFRKNNVANHANARHVFRPRAGLARFISVDEGDVSRKSYKRLHRWRYSPTAAYGNNEVHLHPYKSRRISVAESLAIQSLPKTFTLPPDMSLSSMFKTVGNGVPYLAAKGLAHSLKSFLERIPNETNGIGPRASYTAASKKSRI